MLNIVGVSSATRTPNIYMQLVLAAGQASSASAVDKVVVIGHSTNTTNFPAGVLYGPDTLNGGQTVQWARSTFGVNSELTKFISNFFAVNKQNPLYVIPVLDSGTQSAYKLTFSGTVTYTNTLNIWVNNVFIQVPVYFGDSLSDSTLSTRIANAINGAKAEFTCVAASGSFTIIAGSPGARNALSIQYYLSTPDSGISFSTTSAGYGSYSGSTYTTLLLPTSTIATTGLAGGIDSAIAALGTNQIYHKVLIPGLDESATSGWTTVAPFISSLTAQQTPTVGNRTVGYTSSRIPSTGGVPGLVNQTSYTNNFAVMTNNTYGTKSATMNNARFEIAWASMSDCTAAEILADYVAPIALFSQNIDQPYALNMCNFGADSTTSGYWALPAPRSRYTETATIIENALEAGLSVIGYNNGGSYIVRRSTSQCVDASGNPDQRIADPHKILVLDHFATDLTIQLRQLMAGKVLIDAPIDSNDPISANSIAITYVKTATFALIDNYAQRSLIQNPTASKKTAVFVRSTGRGDTIAIQIPLQIIEIAAEAWVELDQV